MIVIDWEENRLFSHWFKVKASVMMMCRVTIGLSVPGTELDLHYWNCGPNLFVNLQLLNHRLILTEKASSLSRVVLYLLEPFERSAAPGKILSVVFYSFKKKELLKKKRTNDKGSPPPALKKLQIIAHCLLQPSCFRFWQIVGVLP